MSVKSCSHPWCEERGNLSVFLAGLWVLVVGIFRFFFFLREVVLVIGC